MSFELPIIIQPSDIDEQGHVNNVTYVRWIQDVAVAHWTAEAPAEDQESTAWVVVRHEIDYKLAAFPADEIIARTWVGAATRIRFERLTEILRAADHAVLVQAKTIWCPIDKKTGRPRAVSGQVRTKFSRLVP